MNELDKIIAELRQPLTMSQFAGAHDMASALLLERAQIADRLTALTDAAGGGDWVLVPKEAREGMLSVGHVVYESHAGPAQEAMRHAWTAMLAAAPQPPAQGEGEALFAKCYRELCKAVGREGYDIESRDGQIFIHRPAPAQPPAAAVGELPPLPNAALCDVEAVTDAGDYKFYTAEQMRQYARDAIRRLSAPPAAGVDAEAISRALNAQPFVSRNDATRVWQTIHSTHQGSAAEIMHAALRAAASAGGGDNADGGLIDA